VWGVRLVLRTDRRGLRLGYTLVPANEHEYEPLLDLVASGETLIADKGLWGRAYNERMQSVQVRLLTPARERTAANQ
jgi:IS5 family transposase